MAKRNKQTKGLFFPVLLKLTSSFLGGFNKRTFKIKRIITNLKITTMRKENMNMKSIANYFGGNLLITFVIMSMCISF